MAGKRSRLQPVEHITNNITAPMHHRPAWDRGVPFRVVLEGVRIIGLSRWSIKNPGED
jgi:hypothetical protein